MKIFLILISFLTSVSCYSQSDSLVLNKSNKEKLTNIIMKMIDNNEPEETIKFVIKDFKSKYGQSSTDWLYVTSSVKNTDYYIKNIKHRLNVYDFWIKATLSPKKYKNKKGILIENKPNYSVEHWKIYCDLNQYEILSYTEYNSDGIVKLTEEYHKEIKDIIPDSITEGVKDYVCKNSNN